MLVLVTGDPVPAVQSARGGFVELIRATVGEVWSGGWVVKDARTEPLDAVPHAWSGVIITGSPASLTEPSPWMAPALIYTRRLVEACVPTLGICFGHQLLGEALGGSVARNPAGREIGTVSLQVNSESPLMPIPGDRSAPSSVAVNMTHLDSVVRLPTGARVLGRTAQEPHAFVEFGPAAWGVQFHPEIDAEAIRQYIQHREADLLNEGRDIPELLASASETPHSHSLLRRFVQYATERR